MMTTVNLQHNFVPDIGCVLKGKHDVTVQMKDGEVFTNKITLFMAGKYWRDLAKFIEFFYKRKNATY